MNQLKKEREAWIKSSSKFLAAYAATYNLASEESLKALAEFIEFHLTLAYDAGHRDDVFRA